MQKYKYTIGITLPITTFLIQGTKDCYKNINQELCYKMSKYLTDKLESVCTKINQTEFTATYEIKCYIFTEEDLEKYKKEIISEWLSNNIKISDY